MIEINLLPDVKRELLHAQRARAVVVSASIFSGIVAIAVVAVLAIYIFAVQSARNGLADKSIDENSAKLESVKDLSKMLTIQNQLNRIDSLNQTKKLDSRLFDMLQAVIPPAPNSIQVASLSMDAETSLLTIEAQTPSYDSVEVFKKTIEGAVVTYTTDGEEQMDPLAEEVSLTDVSYGEDATGQRVVRFKLSFTYPESLLSASIPRTLIKLTNEGNVTDSYLGIPKSIFIDEEGGE